MTKIDAIFAAIEILCETKKRLTTMIRLHTNPTKTFSVSISGKYMGGVNT